MDCRCLRCDRRFALSEEEAARCRQHYLRRGVEPPDETVGICHECWEPDSPADKPRQPS